MHVTSRIYTVKLYSVRDTYLYIKTELIYNAHKKLKIKLHNVLYPNICGGDRNFDLIWIERSVNIYITQIRIWTCNYQSCMSENTTWIWTPNVQTLHSTSRINTLYWTELLTGYCLQYKLYTGLFISTSGISEFDCATTQTDTAERSISIGRESLQVFLY